MTEVGIQVLYPHVPSIQTDQITPSMIAAKTTRASHACTTANITSSIMLAAQE